MDFKSNLRNYAETIIKVGANVQKGQLVIIRGLTEMREFVYELSEAAYKNGASDVQVMWSDDIINRQRYKYATKEAIEEYPKWLTSQHNDYIDKGAVFISIIGSDPKNLEGLDVEKIKAGSLARGKGLVYFYEALMSDKNSWVVVGAATKAWAKVVFPELEVEKAYNKLWDLIFYTTRIDGENSLKNWQEHVEILESKAKYLNDNKFKYLKYTSKKGTNLTIELPEKHLWKAASAINSKGISFRANMPTEEVYTLPSKNGVNGIVYSTKALNYNGNIIDEFWLEFKDGVAINYGAKKGEEVLKTLLEIDEGSRRLGEVALVPHNSPISNTNIMFFETLYDENASCHLALGNAYPTCLDGGPEMSKEELEKNLANYSLAHVDFMIGDETLKIVGIKENGIEVEILVDGNWV